ncbi:heat shock 70 kDa protein 12B-like [Mya arenaria]|uniref:heat shock 70 kDa protein 12B-like n=1 Tax=Mya arenaria TaxID=6604 RepID=UPI0022E35F23|nr:heat shock 70 kDa protein 12B-like [Mya arenaria]
MLFRKFKMILYQNTKLDEKTTVQDLTKKKEMPALKIFSLSLKYLKDHALDNLNLERLCITEQDITFVVTVPAIWDDRARMFMREAAVEAGIPRNQLVMALESEAASVWCQRVPVAMDKSAFTQDNSRYMVVDLGGGTADITVHQKLRTGQLKQLCADFGGKWGGQEVDNNFVQLLTRCLGREAMNTFYDECLHDVFDLLREFEMTKRSVAPTENGKVRIRLPVSLTEITQKKLSKSKGRELFLKSLIASDYGDKVSIAKDKLKIDAEIIKRMFVDCISKTIDAIKDKFKGDPRISDVKNVLVVGGFAECAIVQAEMKERLLKVKKKLVFPPEAGLAVLNGAVLFGHEPTIIASRKTRFTYGLKRKTDGKNTFHIFIEKEEEYTNGHVVTVNDWPLLDKKGGYATFELFMSTSKTPTLVTDPTCKNVGKLEMKVHNSCTACEVSLVFDTDAVMLRIKEPETGDVITKMFDFI